MAPMLASVFGWISLIKQMPVALPIGKPIRIVERTLRTNKMIERPIRVLGLFLSRFSKAQHQWISFKLLFLLFQGCSKSGFRNRRNVWRFVRLRETLMATYYNK